jgi:hypothetical protein
MTRPVFVATERSLLVNRVSTDGIPRGKNPSFGVMMSRKGARLASVGVTCSLAE